MANAAKPQETAGKREKLQDQNQRADVTALMATPEGRRVVWRFLERAQVFGSAFNPNAMTQSHTIGWQDAGKWWLAEIERSCPEKYSVMANEARKAAKQAAFEDQQEDEKDDD